MHRRIRVLLVYRTAACACIALRRARGTERRRGESSSAAVHARAGAYGQKSAIATPPRKTMATILCRFLDEAGQEFVGQPVATDAESGLPTEVQLLAEQNIFGDLALGEEKKAVSKVLAPLDPKAILCIGLNYAKHAAESGMAVPKNPVLFMKTVSTLNHPGDPIGAQRHVPVPNFVCTLSTQLSVRADLPKIESKPDWEVELAIVIGKPAKNVSEAEALDYVLGYTVANDVSGREWQIGPPAHPPASTYVHQSCEFVI